MTKEEAAKELHREIERFNESPDYAQIMVCTTRNGEPERIAYVSLEVLRLLAR